MNLTGKWKGTYTLGRGYPAEVVGKTDPFDIEIIDNDGNLTGICIDYITKDIPNNESTIEGVFKENYISFIKKYRYYSVFDDSGKEETANDDIKVDGIHYTGRLYKGFFSRRVYIKGEWTITSEIKNDGKMFWNTVEGTWSMERI